MAITKQEAKRIVKPYIIKDSDGGEYIEEWASEDILLLVSKNHNDCYVMTETIDDIKWLLIGNYTQTRKPRSPIYEIMVKENIHR